MLYLKCELKLIIDMENNNSKMNSIEDIVSAIKEDKVFMTVIQMISETTVKIEEIINNYEGDNSCRNISSDNFTSMELFYISCFKQDIIDLCNYHKPRYELIDIDLIDAIVILKVKV